MDEHKLLRERDRGKRAEILLKDELLIEAFAAVEAALLAKIKDSKAEQGALREDAWRSLKLLEKVNAALVSHIRSGKFAAADLDVIEKKRGPVAKLREAMNV